MKTEMIDPSSRALRIRACAISAKAKNGFMACWLASALLIGASTNAQAQIATRTMPATYEPGQPFTVEIAVNPDAPDGVIEDAIPPGWAVDTQTGGLVNFRSFDPRTSVIRWSRLTTDPTALSYRVTPPADATGAATFAGQFTTSSTIDIGGRTTVNFATPPTAPTTPGGPPPTIVEQPQNRIVPVGGSFTLSVTAENATTYEWRRDDFEIPGANGPSLTVTDATTEDEGTYKVIVSNFSGFTVSEPATVQVTTNPTDSPPAIVEHPQDTLVPVGGSATLSVTAENATRYEWRRNDFVIPGVSGPSLTIINANTEDAGTYRVIASNLFGSVTSDAATVEVTTDPIPSPEPPEPPVIIQHPEDKTVPRGESVTFSVTATGATGYQWQRNRIDIPGATESTYTIPKVTIADAGTYRVVVSRESLSIFSESANLVVTAPVKETVPPSIISPPQSQAVAPGSPVVFTVIAENATSYQWLRNGKPIRGATEMTFKIPHATEDHEGVYRVLVSNKRATIKSTGATLTVVTLIKPHPESAFTLDTSTYPDLVRVYNLSGTYEYTFLVGDRTAEVQYTLGHCGRGRLSGRGTMTISGLDPESHELNVYGTIRRLGTTSDSIYRVDLSLWATGEVLIDGGLNAFHVAIEHTLEIDPDQAQLVGTLEPSKIEPEELGDPATQEVAIALPTGRDGEWTMTIIPFRKGGGIATIEIQGDRIFYDMIVREPSETNRTIYNLYSISKAESNLRVDLDPDKNLLFMMGVIKGQNVTIPPVQ